MLNQVVISFLNGTEWMNILGASPVEVLSSNPIQGSGQWENKKGIDTFMSLSVNMTQKKISLIIFL